MKKTIMILICFIIIITSNISYAKEGNSGYEGGISSGQNLSTSKSNIEYEYEEVVFLSGQPIILKGKLGIKKKTSSDIETTTYQYNLSDSNNNTLSRTITLQSKLVNKGNNQVIKETSIYKIPSETITLGNTTYTLLSYFLTKSSLLDPKAGADYYAGDITSKKVYYKGEDEANTVTVTTKGEFYGYDQKWSDAESQILEYFLENESEDDSWTGTAKVRISSIRNTGVTYHQNSLEEISFDGGYVQSENTTSNLKYESKMPRFDKNGVSTDKIITKRGSFKIDAFPIEKRLIVQDLSSIRGHWAENDIKKIYSLEIYDESPSIFIPNQYISRAEFAKALVKAIDTTTITTTATTKTKKRITSPYEDVEVTSLYFPYIRQLTSDNVLSGYGDGKFYPYETLTRVQAIEAFIKVLGLEGMSKDQYPVTVFKDNDKIPQWALRSVDAATKIGFVSGEDGYLVPDRYLTKAEAAVFINRLINYMSETLSKSYSENVLNF